MLKRKYLNKLNSKIKAFDKIKLSLKRTFLDVKQIVPNSIM